jgi:hypothetical protein
VEICRLPDGRVRALAQPVRKISLIVQHLAVVVLGLMCGSELNVAAFSYPMLDKQPLDVHIAVRSSLVRQFGRVMPFRMIGS